MKPFSCTATCLFALIVVVGCASTDVTERQSSVGEEKIARPDRIIIYDFTTTPAEARSTLYCTDVAKMIQIPIFHVNGDDPDKNADAAENDVQYS